MFLLIFFFYIFFLGIEFMVGEGENIDMLFFMMGVVVELFINFL